MFYQSKPRSPYTYRKESPSRIGCSRCDWVQTGISIGNDYCPRCGQPKVVLG